MSSYELRVTSYELRREFAWALIGVLAAAFVSLILSFQAGFFTLLFLTTAFWVWRYPQEGFLLFMVIAPILPMLKITQTISTLTLIKDIIILTLCGKVFVLPLLQKKLPYRPNILAAPIIALVGWSTFELMRANSTILGVLRLRDILLYIFLYIAVIYLPWSKKYLRRCLLWFGITFAVVAALGAYQWFFAVDSAVMRFDPVRQTWIPRLSSILAHPSIFGQYLIVAATLCGAIILAERNTVLRSVSGVAFAAALVLILLTYSRAVWAGTAGAMIVMSAVYALRFMHTRARGARTYRHIALLGIVAIAMLLGVTKWTPAGSIIRSSFDPTYGSNEERLTFLARLIAPTTRFEVFMGRGLGDVLEQNFRRVDLQTYDIATGASRAVQLTKNRTLVDNQHLKTFIEMGVVGLVIYGWIYFRLIKHQLAIAQFHKGDTGSYTRLFGFPILAPHRTGSGAGSNFIISLWGIGFLTACIIQGFFIDIWDIFPTNAAFWIIAALLSISSHIRTAPDR